MNTRLNNTKHVSLNESIAYVNSPQRELDEAREYALALEEVLLALCEGLDIDPEALVEDVMTAARQKEHEKRLSPLYRKGRVAHRRAMKANFSDKKLNRASDKIDREIEKARRGKGGYSTEMNSKKVYGRGGKVLKRKEREGDIYSGSKHDRRGYTD